MAKAWSMSLLLMLPMAAPATAPIPGEVRWDSAPAFSYKIRAGDTMASIAGRALGDPGQVAALAAANDLTSRSALRAGTVISIPSSMLRRDMLKAKVVSFAGDVTLDDGLALASGSEIGEGDIISIGTNSFVTLDMGIAGRVTLPSQSRVHIAELHKVALTGAVNRRLESLPLLQSWLPGGRESVAYGAVSG